MKRWTIRGLVILNLAGIVLTATARQPKTGSNSEHPQSFSYAAVISHFQATHLRTTEVQPRCTIFFEGEWKNQDTYSYALIIVENSDEDIQVTFHLTDAHEMNWVTEFLDAPYFSRAETGQLFDLLYSGHEARNKRIGRFQVDFHRWQPKHADILVFSFTPTRSDRH